MQIPSWEIHIAYHDRCVQRGKLKGQLLRVLRLNALLAACFKEELQSFMSEALNHLVIL